MVIQCVVDFPVSNILKVHYVPCLRMSLIYRLKNTPCVYIFCLHTLYICISGYLHYFYHVAIMTTEVIIYNFHNKRSPSPLRLLSGSH